MMIRVVIGWLALAACVTSFSPVARAAVVEDFESGRFAAPWIDAGNGGFPGTPDPVISSAGAHDGRLGVENGDGNWQYRTDAAAMVGAGTVVSVWFRPTGTKFGALNLAFGADSMGASSFYIHSYFDKIAFQNNGTYSRFTDTISGTFTFEADKWYLATVTIGPTTIGRIFGADGTTLLASLVATGLTRGMTGGIAVRGVGELNYDTIAVTPFAVGAEVPEPLSWLMFLAGFGVVGATLRRATRSPIAYPFDIRTHCG